ncbi:hypothetical protein Ancab_013780 [Ancistrocladus abbreviatus]
MDSYTDNPFHQDHQAQQQNSGLLRFRSVPSSLLMNFDKDAAFCKGYDYNQSPRFLTSTACGGGDGGRNSFEVVESKPLIRMNSQNGLIGQSHVPPHPRQSLVSTSRAMEGSYGVEGPMEMEQSTKRKVVSGSNLARQSSSPAGFFVHLNAQNGNPMLRGMGNFKTGNGNVEESSPRTSRLKRQVSGLSSVGLLPRIPEIGNENIRETSPDGVRFRNGESDVRFFGTGFSFLPWDDSARMFDNASEAADQQNDQISYSGSDASISQSGGLGNRPHVLSHHLSLPKTSAEMAAIEKLFHFQDIVPCKIRAKRGCATHPRSIAERVRRARISERMKKLQELVPNMDKQMNTADMLDLAVEYIKELQEQYKTLSNKRARCTCLNGRKSAAVQAV